MTTVQPGQVVEVDGLPYLILGKTKTEYDVGTKVLIECEHLTIDPASLVVEIKGIEIVGQGNGQRVDSLVSLLPDREREKSRHNRSRCMRCKAPPVIDVHWADGRGRAWFCQKCFRPWIGEIKKGEFGDPGIVRAWHIPDGEVSKKFGGKGTTRLRKLGSNIPAGAIADRLDEIIATTWMRDSKRYEGVIVALVPHLPVTTRLAQAARGAVPVTDLHITLAHLGKTRQLAHNRQTIEDILSEIASVTPPIRYKIGGHGRFLALSDNVNETFKRPLDVVYASVDSPQLPDLHNKLVQALEAAGIEISSDHGFTPHITLAYTSDKEWVPDLKPMYGVADRLVLCWEDEQKGFNLRGSVGYVRKRQQESKAIEETKALAKWLQGRGMMLSGMLEGRKAKGRWRTLKDGHHVMVSGPIRSGITISNGRTKLTIKGKVGQRKVQQAVDAFEALPAWQRRNVKGLTLDGDKGYGVTVGGQNYTAGGDWSANNEINIYNANKANKREMARRISHEAGHAAFDQWRAGATGEYLERARYDHPDWIIKGDPFDPQSRDRIKPQYLDRAAKEYPHFASQTRFMDAFQRQDGVTPYSKQWTRQEGRGSHLAMTETFAELAEMYSRTVQRNGERTARSMLPSMAGARDVAKVFLDVVDIMDRSRKSKEIDTKAAKRENKRISRATFNDKWEPVPAGSRATHLVEIETDKGGNVKRVTYFDAETTGSKATKLPKSGGRWRTLRDGRRVYVTKQEDI